ncbi:hypothetical protein, partial [Mycobacterium gastri]|uniref:hypothetical protein n=1 Tax=Mycobacterium gastri TaxID=1777 RepID=UPI001ABEEDDD
MQLESPHVQPVDLQQQELASFMRITIPRYGIWVNHAASITKSARETPSVHHLRMPAKWLIL